LVGVAKHAAGGVDVTVIIVTYNSARHIRDCLESLSTRNAGTSVEIIVLDNGSSDGTCDLVAAAFPRVRLERLGRNAGFGGACNEGARAARGRYLFFLNPDTRLESDAVGILAAALDARPAPAFCSATLVDDSGQPTKSFGDFPRLRTQIRRSATRTLVLTVPFLARGRRGMAGGGARASGLGTFPVRFASGAALMVRKALFEDLDGFDERFFMYGEEAELQFRAARAGVRRLVSREARIYHAEGASFRVPLRRWAMLELSYRRFVEKQTPLVGRLLGFPALSLVRFVEALAEHARDRDIGVLLAKTAILARFAFRWRYGCEAREYLRIAGGTR
jgi:GT2 family glycosyltransferase